MKFPLTTIASLFILIKVLPAQKRYEQEALFAAKQMTWCYNGKDYTKYVDYLLPSYYGNDTANKKGLAANIRQFRTNEKHEVAQLLKMKTFKGERQAVFLHRVGQRDFYIVGINNIKDKQWYFSQPLSQEVQFDFVLLQAPSLDTAFAAIIDPKYGKRITFEKNQTFEAFHFTDINGNVLSSKDLTGKVLVFNFWSITCGPCIKEIPHLNTLVESMKGKDVVFIAPAFYSPKEYLVGKFLPKYPFAYTIVEITNPDDYNILAFPTHVVTDKNHNIIFKAVDANPETVKELDKVIENALNNKPA
jgi:thiol-disulfide isomerase/thioredoxin